MAIDLLTGATVWIWENYGKELTDQAVGHFKNKWEKFTWGEAASTYRDRIRDLCSTTRILGNPRPITIHEIYTEILVMDQPMASNRYDIEQLKREPRTNVIEKKETKHALSLIIANPKLMVLGKPGAGKTTLLKHVTLLTVEAKLNAIPIFISCKDWNDSKLSLLDFIEKQFEICSFPEASSFIKFILDRGKSIVMFDGLDEINEKNREREKAIIEITNFTNTYPNVRFIISSRVSAVDYSFEKFTYVEIADFNEKQIEEFVSKWFKSNHEKRDTFMREFNEPEQAGLKELGKTPLLLTLLCLAFDQTMRFPKRKIELYEDALDALLKKWDASRNIRRESGYRFLSLGRKKQMLSRIAADSFDQGKAYLTERELVNKIAEYLEGLPIDETQDIDGSNVLSEIEAQHGILVEVAHNIHAFSHLTFQEYFTSKHICDNSNQGSFEKLVNDNLQEDRWRDVFLLVASQLDNAEIFLDILKKGVDSIVQKDQKLVQVIRWAEIKANKHYEGVSNPAFARAIALDIDTDRERAFVSASSMARANSAIETKDLARALALVSSRTGKLVDIPNYQNLSLSPSAAIVYEKELSEERKRALEMSQACSLIIALARDLAFVLGIDLSGQISLDQLSEILSSAFRFCIRAGWHLGLQELSPALENINFPKPTDPVEKLRSFREELREIMMRYRSIGYNWNLSTEQIKTLRAYSNANILLMDCLRLAYVSNREEIEDSLLLLP